MNRAAEQHPEKRVLLAVDALSPPPKDVLKHPKVDRVTLHHWASIATSGYYHNTLSVIHTAAQLYPEAAYFAKVDSDTVHCTPDALDRMLGFGDPIYVGFQGRIFFQGAFGVGPCYVVRRDLAERSVGLFNSQWFKDWTGEDRMMAAAARQLEPNNVVLLASPDHRVISITGREVEEDLKGSSLIVHTGEIESHLGDRSQMTYWMQRLIDLRLRGLSEISPAGLLKQLRSNPGVLPDTALNSSGDEESVDHALFEEANCEHV